MLCALIPGLRKREALGVNVLGERQPPVGQHQHQPCTFLAVSNSTPPPRVTALHSRGIWDMMLCIIQRGADKGLIFNNMIRREPKTGPLSKSTAGLAKSIFQIWKGKILDGTKSTKKQIPKPKLFKYFTQSFPRMKLPGGCCASRAGQVSRRPRGATGLTLPLTSPVLPVLLAKATPCCFCTNQIENRKDLNKKWGWGTVVSAYITEHLFSCAGLVHGGKLDHWYLFQSPAGKDYVQRLRC